MKRADAEPDLAWLAALPGIKVLCKGNHDYWWDSDKALNFPGLHDTPFVSDDGQIGVAGTRGWFLPAAARRHEKAQCGEDHRPRSVAPVPAAGSDQRLPRQDRPDPLSAARRLRAAAESHGVETVLYGHLHLNGNE